jgi:hypothetical protein
VIGNYIVTVIPKCSQEFVVHLNFDHEPGDAATVLKIIE